MIYLSRLKNILTPCIIVTYIEATTNPTEFD